MVSGLRFYEENVLVCDFHFIQVIKKDVEKYTRSMLQCRLSKLGY